MKKIMLGIALLTSLSVNAQGDRETFKQHYRVMTSLWNKDAYDSLIRYIQQVESYFIKFNGSPGYDYYRLQVEYLAPAYREMGKYEAAEEILLKVLSALNGGMFKMHPIYYTILKELGLVYVDSGRFTLAHANYNILWERIDYWEIIDTQAVMGIGSDLIAICASMGKYNEIPLYEKRIDKIIVAGKCTQDELLDYYMSLAATYGQMMATKKTAFYITKLNEILRNNKVDFFRRISIKIIESTALLFSNQISAAESTLLPLIKELEAMGLNNIEFYFMAKYILAYCYTVAQKNSEADSLLSSGMPQKNSMQPENLGIMHLGKALLTIQQRNLPKALAGMDSSIYYLNTATNHELQSAGYAHLCRLAILLKLGKNQTAIGAYNQFMATYMPYIRSNISHLSEVEKNNIITSDFFEMARAGLGLLGKDKSGDADGFTQKVWNQMIFFRGLAMGEQTKLYNLLRQTQDSAAQKLYTEWLELKQYLQAEAQKPAIVRNKSLESLAVLAEKKEKQLAQYLPQLSRRQPDNVIPTLYGHLKPGEALVDFNRYMRFTTQLVDSIWYGAFILAHGKPKPLFINVCAENNIIMLMNGGFRGNATNKALALLYPPDRLNQHHDLPGNYLYHLLWKPLQPYLTGIHTVYVVADGLLHKIALHALPLEKGGYLCDKINIRYLSHCNRLGELQLRKSKKIEGIQLWGGIQYHTDTVPSRKQLSELNIASEKEWDYLPGTLREVENIGQLARYRNIPAQVFSGNNATEQSLKQQASPQYDILHIATHGQFDTGFYFRRPRFALPTNLPFAPSKDPMRQVFLIMAGRNTLKADTSGSLGGNEGLLDAGEIARLNLAGKQLVTLSACESGRGNVISAEGVFGMTRAFTMAGAEKIIISLWDVKDNASAEMMRVFYGELFAGKPIATSFKTAQQYMRKKYPPYYWAGFVLIE